MNFSPGDIHSLNPEALLTQLDPERHLQAYFDLLTVENKKVNLVSRETGPAGLLKLAAESLLPFETNCHRKAARYLDIGSGGGFPAIPIMLCCEVGSATLVERTQKKASALCRILGELKLEAEVLERTFEEVSFDSQFDLLTIRLVRLTPSLFKQAESALAPGGTMIYYAPIDESIQTAGLHKSTICYRVPPDDLIKTITIVHE